MEWRVVTLFIVYSLPSIIAEANKKVKILLPMPVQHVHHTKIVKVPEYHHYFHDKNQQQSRKRYPMNNDFEDPAYYDEQHYFQSGMYNDFDYFPEQNSNAFHERLLHTPPLTMQMNGKGSKRNVQHQHQYHLPQHPTKKNKKGFKKNQYKPQHFYHRMK